MTEDLMVEFDGWDESRLSKLALINAIIHAKMRNKIEIQGIEHAEVHKRTAESAMMEHHQLTTKYLELQNLHMREQMRPYKLNHAVIGYDSTEKMYTCTVQDLSGELGEIVSYGDTPSEACNNFDLLWMGLQDDE